MERLDQNAFCSFARVFQWLSAASPFCFAINNAPGLRQENDPAGMGVIA
ncbi:MAG: hypothetical protein WCD79_16035 [Chthoniobacteraceae bacterium]